MQHPVANARVLDVHEFRTDRPGVNCLKRPDHIPQRHLSVVEEEFRGNTKIEVLFAETEFAQSQQRISRAFLYERIYARNGVPKNTVSVRESVHPRLQRTFANFHWLGDCAIVFRHLSELEAFEKGGPSRID